MIHLQLNTEWLLKTKQASAACEMMSARRSVNTTEEDLSLRKQSDEKYYLHHSFANVF